MLFLALRDLLVSRVKTAEPVVAVIVPLPSGNVLHLENANRGGSLLRRRSPIRGSIGVPPLFDFVWIVFQEIREGNGKEFLAPPRDIDCQNLSLEFFERITN